MAECVYFTINTCAKYTINKPHIYNKQQKLIPKIEAFEQVGPRLIHWKKMKSYPLKQVTYSSFKQLSRWDLTKEH